MSKSNHQWLYTKSRPVFFSLHGLPPHILYLSLVKAPYFLSENPTSFDSPLSFSVRAEVNGGFPETNLLLPHLVPKEKGTWGLFHAAPLWLDHAQFLAFLECFSLILDLLLFLP